MFIIRASPDLAVKLFSAGSSFAILKENAGAGAETGEGTGDERGRE
jgi:hypothetical protein